MRRRKHFRIRSRVIVTYNDSPYFIYVPFIVKKEECLFFKIVKLSILLRDAIREVKWCKNRVIKKMFIACDCYTVSECYADKSDAMYSFRVNY